MQYYLQEPSFECDVQGARAHDYVAAGNLSLALGYDAGVKGAFASVTGDTTVSNKDVRATGTWFQKGNHIRTEASVNLDGRSNLWGT